MPAASPAADQPESNVVIVDGSNVAHSTEGEKPRIANLIAVRDKLKEEGLEPIIMADAALRHQIDDATQYEQMVDSGAIRQVPAGTDADYFILSFARELNATIVSNDRFRDRLAQFPEAQRSGHSLHDRESRSRPRAPDASSRLKVRDAS